MNEGAPLKLMTSTFLPWGIRSCANLRRKSLRPQRAAAAELRLARWRVDVHLGATHPTQAKQSRLPRLDAGKLATGSTGACHGQCTGRLQAAHSLSMSTTRSAPLANAQCAASRPTGGIGAGG